MQHQNASSTPQLINALVVFGDLTQFTRISRQMDPPALFNFLSEFATRVQASLEHSEGVLIKFIGDAFLAFYPENAVDAGVQHLFVLKTEIDSWLKSQKYPSHLYLKAHYGEVMLGSLGNSSPVDIIGETVNIAASLTSQSLALTPQVFRKLAPETRQRFKKHTPPIRYIPVEEHHRD
jgi:class 3 adenylate cyclase